jgi:hypothetical protein
VTLGTRESVDILIAETALPAGHFLVLPDGLDEIRHETFFCPQSFPMVGTLLFHDKSPFHE